MNNQKMPLMSFVLRVISSKKMPTDIEQFLTNEEKKYPDRKYDRNIRIMGTLKTGVQVRCYYFKKKA